MDRSGRREQRRHGGARAGRERDDADQPGRHEHRRLPHPLITDHSSPLLKPHPQEATKDDTLLEGGEKGSGALDVLSLRYHTHTHTQVILLARLVRHFIKPLTSP